MSSFNLIWFFLPIIAFIVGYFMRQHLDKRYKVQKEENEINKETIRKLNGELEACRKRSIEYKDELDTIKARLNEKAKEKEELDIPISDHKTSSKEESKEADLNGIIAPSPDIGQVPEPDLIPQGQEPRRTSKFESLNKSNLQIIEGIGPKMESVLKENGVNQWSQLGDQTQETLRSILENYGNKYKIIDPDSWPEQASLAAKGNWSQLVRMQKGFNMISGVSIGNTPAKVEKIMIKLGIIKEFKQDDLKAIEGIGPKIAELLNTEGINSWEELSKTSVSALQNILDKAGKRYQLADPGSWPKQASLAVEGRFDELSDYQEILLGGV